MDLGSTIKKIRTKYGLSQDQMAEKLHVTRQTVSNWENNKHYPDLATLIRISEDFAVPLDDMVKSDEEYVRETDKVRRKLNKLQKVLLGLGAFLLATLIGLTGLFLFLHSAYQGTPNDERIQSDTDVRLIVDLPGMSSAPSSAITDTYKTKTFTQFSRKKQDEIRSRVTGKVEGDIPRVYTEQREQSRIDFVFQKEGYRNIAPEIDEILLYRKHAEAEQRIEKRAISVPYTYRDGVLTIYATDFTDLNGEPGHEEDNALFELRYREQGVKYTSFTAVNVFYNDYIDWATAGEYRGFEESGAAGYVQYIGELHGNRIRYRVTYDEHFMTRSGTGGFSVNNADTKEEDDAEAFAYDLVDKIGSVEVSQFEKLLRDYYEKRGGTVTVKEKKGAAF